MKSLNGFIVDATGSDGSVSSILYRFSTNGELGAVASWWLNDTVVTSLSDVTPEGNLQVVASAFPTDDLLTLSPAGELLANVSLTPIFGETIVCLESQANILVTALSMVPPGEEGIMLRLSFWNSTGSSPELLSTIFTYPSFAFSTCRFVPSAASLVLIGSVSKEPLPVVFVVDPFQGSLASVSTPSLASEDSTFSLSGLVLSTPATTGTGITPGLSVFTFASFNSGKNCSLAVLSPLDATLSFVVTRDSGLPINHCADAASGAFAGGLLLDDTGSVPLFYTWLFEPQNFWLPSQIKTMGSDGNLFQSTPVPTFGFISYPSFASAQLL